MKRLPAVALLAVCARPLAPARGGATPAAKRSVLPEGSLQRRLLSPPQRVLGVSAAIHFAHGKAHDVPLLTPLSEHERADREFVAECVKAVHNPPHAEPTMEYYGPYTAQVAFGLYRAIDWTHMHHEQTYDILSHRSIPWSEKKRWAHRALRYYLDKLDLPVTIGFQHSF